MRILIGVTGGVAAYKAVELTRLCVKAGHSVRVIQTPASLRFVGRAAFASVTGAPVLASEFEDDPARGAWPGDAPPPHSPISHLALAERADVFVVAPATANAIARLAAGAGEDLVTTSVLAARCPIVVAPAMNGRMWDGDANQSNVEVLRKRGITVLDPEEGLLASRGEEGRGRLVEPAAILAAVQSIASRESGSLHGCAVLVTAGGTREPIDEVRFIGNRSSGRMGIAVAEECAARGATVTLVAANVPGVRPAGVETVQVATAAEMQREVIQRIPECDALVMAAAVADFRPVTSVSGKIDKSEGVPLIELEPVDDILAAVAGIRTESQVVIGFAAEHGVDRSRAKEKLTRKRLDAIVFNDISNPTIGFDSDHNEVTLMTPDTEIHVDRRPKRLVAVEVVDLAVDLLSRRVGAPGSSPEPG